MFSKFEGLKLVLVSKTTLWEGLYTVYINTYDHGVTKQAHIFNQFY